MMPVEYRWMIFGIILCNTVAVVGYEFFIVNGIRQRKAAQKAKEMEAANGEHKVQHRGSNYGARRASVEVDMVTEYSNKRDPSQKSFPSRRMLMEGVESSQRLDQQQQQKVGGGVSTDFSTPGRRKSVFLADSQVEI